MHSASKVMRLGYDDAQRHGTNSPPAPWPVEVVEAAAIAMQPPYLRVVRLEASVFGARLFNSSVFGTIVLARSGRTIFGIHAHLAT